MTLKPNYFSIWSSNNSPYNPSNRLIWEVYNCCCPFMDMQLNIIWPIIYHQAFQYSVDVSRIAPGNWTRHQRIYWEFLKPSTFSCDCVMLFTSICKSEVDEKNYIVAKFNHQRIIIIHSVHLLQQQCLPDAFTHKYFLNLFRWRSLWLKIMKR